MKTYKEFKEAVALALPALKAAPYVIPALGGIVKGVSAITNRETGLSDSEKRRVGELMDIIKRKKQREKTQQTEKDILDYGRKKEGIAERPKKAVNEALARMFVKAVAKQVFKNRGVAKAARNVIKQSTNAPKQLKFGKTFHGTTQKASGSISKGGWRTDTNVTRQMSGSKVYTAGDNYSAANYALDRARKFSDKPALRQFRVPQSVMQKQTTKATGGVGDYSGKGYKMTTLSPQQANKYDVTDKVSRNKYDLDALMSPEKKRELRGRVRRGLRQRAGREELRRDIKRGEEQSLTALYRYRNNPQDPRTLEKVLQQKKKPLD